MWRIFQRLGARFALHLQCPAHANSLWINSSALHKTHCNHSVAEMTLMFFFLREIRTIGCCTASSPPSKAPKRHQTASSTAWRVECAHRGIFRIDRIAETCLTMSPFPSPVHWASAPVFMVRGSWLLLLVQVFQFHTCRCRCNSRRVL